MKPYQLLLNFMSPLKKQLIQFSEDHFMLTLAIYREARGEPRHGKRLVGEVILNRARDPKRWADTVSGVVTQPYQFSAFNSGDPNTLKFKPTESASFSEVRAWEECADVALELLMNGAQTPFNHYHAGSDLPKWAQGHVGSRYGHHTFYTL